MNPLSYRSPSDDLPHGPPSTWTLARAWLYAIWFGLLLVGMVTLGMMVILRDGIHGADCGLLFGVAIFGVSFWRSLRSLVLLLRREIKYPFQERS